MNKIEALKKTIYNLENDVYEYEWLDTNKCNCGVVARTILGDELPKQNGMFSVHHLIGGAPPGFHGLYRQALTHCSKTGHPLPRVFQSLLDSGFTPDEMKALERCGCKKEDVITYLKAWVSILEAEKPKEEENKQPSCPDITKELAVLNEFKEIDVPSTCTTISQVASHSSAL